MRKIILLTAVLISMTIKTNAQIPNNDFENWTTVSNYDNPDGWATMNSFCTNSFISCQKSEDSYPTGNYSLKITCKTSLTQITGGWGMVATKAFDYPFKPAFKITGHPTSLSGYFRYIGQNDDSMFVKVILFNNRSIVSANNFYSGGVTLNWTSFNLPFSNYATADSATIIISAFYPSSPTSGPKGNSSLKIDNLIFDNSSSVEGVSAKNTLFDIYPNPASDIITLNTDNVSNTDLILNIYNVVGTLVKSETLKQNNRQINIGDLRTGIYMVEIKSKEWKGKQKLIIQ